jgi:uncharacterized membrane protein YkoI
MNRVLAISIVGVAAVAALTGCACHHTGEEGKEVAVAMNEVPAAVRATLDRESAGGKVTEVEKEMKNGKTVYSADMVVNGVAWDIVIAEDGRVISKEKEKAGEK